MVTDSCQIVVREQWNHPYKEGSSPFLLQTLCNPISVASCSKNSQSQAQRGYKLLPVCLEAEQLLLGL